VFEPVDPSKVFPSRPAPVLQGSGCYGSGKARAWVKVRRSVPWVKGSGGARPVSGRVSLFFERTAATRRCLIPLDCVLTLRALLLDGRLYAGLLDGRLYSGLLDGRL